MSTEDSPQQLKSDPTNSQTYDAACHCGTVQYSVTLSPPLANQTVVSCNCSICSRNGYLFVYPLRENFTLKSGEDGVGSYSFGPKKVLHRFCTRCGSSVFLDPRMKLFGQEPDLLGVNVRMFKDVKLEKLDIRHHEDDR